MIENAKSGDTLLNPLNYMYSPLRRTDEALHNVFIYLRNFIVCEHKRTNQFERVLFLPD